MSYPIALEIRFEAGERELPISNEQENRDFALGDALRMSGEHQETRTTNQEGNEDREPPAGIPFFSRPLVIVIGAALTAIIALFGMEKGVQAYTHESTDNAYLEGRIIALAPKVSGRVAQVRVTDNQRVKAGDILVVLDSRDLEVALDQKRAAQAAAEANEQLLKSSLTVSEAQERSATALARQEAANVAAAQATAEKAKADFERASELSANRTISQQEFDTARAAAQAAEANLQAAREKAESTQAAVTEAQAAAEASRKAVQRATAETLKAAMDVKAAELNLSYATITAPEAGQVTRKSVESGDYVQIGQRLLALVPNDLWVTANFKETQLKTIRVGQHAVVTIDAVKDRSFPAHVDSIQAGSGARFSMLPPENAVGNFVKVVQRVPVKIVFDQPLQAEHTLGPGMSVFPSVRVNQFSLPEALKVALGILIGVLTGLLWFVATRSGREGTDESA